MYVIYPDGMHSGYPLVAKLEEFNRIMHVQSSSKGAALALDAWWGIFHELGHNHQWRSWNTEATTETTCNWWAINVIEQVRGMKTYAFYGIFFIKLTRALLLFCWRSPFKKNQF